MPVFQFLTAVDQTTPESGLGTMFSSLTSIFTFIVGLLGDVVDMITSNNLILVPVVIGFAGGAIMLAVGIVHRLGVGSSGRHRRGRR